jgi:hypothetical protein
VSSDFSAGTFHNRPTHIYEDTSPRSPRISRAIIIPVIHRGVKNPGISKPLGAVPGHAGHVAAGRGESPEMRRFAKPDAVFLT